MVRLEDMPVMRAAHLAGVVKLVTVTQNGAVMCRALMRRASRHAVPIMDRAGVAVPMRHVAANVT
jgi:hypothetical protein